MSETRISVGGGKYTFVVNLGKIDILRHGEPWIQDFQPPGTNAVMAALFDLDEGRAGLANNEIVEHRSSEVAALSEDNAALAAKVRELTQEIARLTAEGNSLKARLAALDDAYEQAVKNLDIPYKLLDAERKELAEARRRLGLGEQWLKAWDACAEAQAMHEYPSPGMRDEEAHYREAFRASLPAKPSGQGEG